MGDCRVPCTPMAISALVWKLLPAVAPIAGALGIIVWRFRETRRPVSERGIVLPPLAMSTGFAMFAVPAMRVPVLWGVAAFLLGLTVFAYPLMRSSRLRRVGEAITLQRSRAFLVILLALLAVRFALRSWIDHHVSPGQTAALLFLLAFGMIVRWRWTMLLEYRRLRGSAPS